MKVAQNVMVLFRDDAGFGIAISDALQPNPSFPFRREESSFELSLERYGIKDLKASGDVIHFIDDKGVFQVTMLLLQNYEPPILACAVNEVLESIVEVESLAIQTLVLPLIVPPSKLKCVSRSLTMTGSEVSLFGVQIGSETDIMRAMVTKCQKLPLPMQIHHEHLACFLHVIRVLKFSTFVLVGQIGQDLTKRASEQEVEIFRVMGELLARTFGLCFSGDRTKWYWTEKSRVVEEPWHALYG